MRVLFFIVVGIFLFFTAPIWVPIVGILGLATGIGAGTAIIAANHASPAAPAPVERPAYVQPAPAQPAVPPQEQPADRPMPIDASPAPEPVVCSWVYNGNRCHTLDEWRQLARTWCDRAAQSTARRQAMQARGWGSNRLFMSPYGAEFAREGQAEAVAGTICAGEEGGLAKAQAEDERGARNDGQDGQNGQDRAAEAE